MTDFFFLPLLPLKAAALEICFQYANKTSSLNQQPSVLAIPLRVCSTRLHSVYEKFSMHIPTCEND